MQFERATENNKEEILALYRSLVGTEYCAWSADYPGEKEIEGDLHREGLFCLRDDEYKIIGTISIDDDAAVEALPCWSKKLRPSAELSRLGVRLENQNQGVACKLLQYAMDELKRQGMKSVHFLVCKTNKKAICSYNKLEFDIVGECQLFGEEWWCYEKAL